MSFKMDETLRFRSEVLVQDNSVPESYALDLIAVSKRFQRAGRISGYSTIKSSFLSFFVKSPRNTNSGDLTRRYQSVLTDINLRVPKGASVGVIGRNGSGKSTLLKIITGIYQPDSGFVSVNGRIAALIELGAGFHPDFTGRENVMLGGIMHGLSRRSIHERFKEIVDFAELSDVIDEPVRTYSSGMFMRLGFSLAVHTDPSILLVDEVLAVGDAAFVAKCKEKLTSLRCSGTTLLLVSHDLDAVMRWCDQVLWIDSGVVRDSGDPRRVIDHYRQFLEKKEEQDRFIQLELQESLTSIQAISGSNDVQELSSDLEKVGQDPVDKTLTRTNDIINEQQIEEQVISEAVEGSLRWGSREIELTKVALTVGHDDYERLVVSPNDEVCFNLHFITHQVVADPVFGVGIFRDDGLSVFGTNTSIDKVKVERLPEKGVITFFMPRLGLAEGVYTIDIAAHASDGYPYDYRRQALKFSVRSGSSEIGVISPDRRWGSDGAFIKYDSHS
jgi:ABC-type polysaccharide/polyol phosphate transport system ATPase subunit